MIHRTQLNFYSGIGLLIASIGLALQFYWRGAGFEFMANLGFIVFLFSAFNTWRIIVPSIVFIIGLLFLIQHWPYARVLILLGSLSAWLGLCSVAKKGKLTAHKIWILSSILTLILAFGVKTDFNYRLDIIPQVYFLGFISLAASYTFRFYLKEDKGLEDILKLCFLVSICLSQLLYINHLPGSIFFRKIMGLVILIFGVFLIWTKSTEHLKFKKF